jgi:hypothetical protein
MNNDINWLITLSNGEYLIKVALKLSPSMLTGDAREACLEPENKAQIMKLLPTHCSSFGNIVEVEELFEIKNLIA